MTATPCLFASDLHGSDARYRALLDAIADGAAAAVFLGGDLLPHPARHPASGDDWLDRALLTPLERLRDRLADRFPPIFVILGNDDGLGAEAVLEDADRRGLLRYVHGRHAACAGRDVYGYACVPPTPFLLKDWERYDVSRFVDPGCVAPEDGWHTVPAEARTRRPTTIQEDLARLAGGAALDRAIFLFHTPPYRTRLDRAALDGVKVDGAPVDVHVGSIAVRRFIEDRQPHLTLHGHIHESARLTGAWRDRIGRTVMLSAAHDGPELALVRFDLDQPEDAIRELR